ncbi:MAG TPA: hypothetical protein VMA95_02575 [Streptosporangiaceae bacterium]|nr:hypothetical protein [Streptosporangiaceae bacterium]
MAEDRGETGGELEEPEKPSAGPGEAAVPVADLLASLRRLRLAARSVRHAYAFPLVLFGLLTLAAMPFYLQSPAPSGGIQILAVRGGQPQFPLLSGSAGPLGSNYNYLGYYWLVALTGGLLATMYWYRYHARKVGLSTEARGYLVTLGVLTGLAVVLPVLSRFPAFGWLSVLWPGDLMIRGTFPFLIIAAALCVLAWAERSLALGAIAAIYLGTALLASLYDIENVLFRLGWNPSPGQWRLTSLPNVLLPALVLLVAGTGVFIAQRRQRRAA